MTKKEKINDKYWVYYGEKETLAKRHLDYMPHEESQELFDKAKESDSGVEFKLDGRVYLLIYKHSNDGYRNYLLIYRRRG